MELCLFFKSNYLLKVIDSSQFGKYERNEPELNSLMSGLSLKDTQCELKNLGVRESVSRILFVCYIKLTYEEIHKTHIL